MRGRRDPERFVRNVGHRVRELRLARRLTQEALAEQLGVATPHVQAIERGVRNLTLVTVCRLADALDVDPLQLFVPPLSDAQTGKPGRPTKEHAASQGPVPMAFYESVDIASEPASRANPVKRGRGQRR